MAQWVIEIPDNFEEGRKVWYSAIDWRYGETEGHLTSVLGLGPIGAATTTAQWHDPTHDRLKLVTEAELEAKIAEYRAIYPEYPT